MVQTMISTPIKTIETLEQFLQRPDIEGPPAWELLESGPQQKPMGTSEHSELQFNLVSLIRSSGTHKAKQELRCNVGGLSPVPDILVDTLDRIPATGHFDGAPLWVIEIRSPDQSTVKLQAKILHFLRYGTELAWLVDVYRKRVTIWQGDDFDLLTGSDRVPALGILDVSVADILAMV